VDAVCAHDNMVEALWEIICVVNEGHSEGSAALEQYWDAWIEELNTGDHNPRSPAETAEEWRRALYTGIDEVVSSKGDAALDECTCGVRERYLLRAGPQNATWLRERLGTGPLPSALLRSGAVLWASAIGEEGYIPPENPDDSNGSHTIAPLSGRQLPTRLAGHYEIGALGKDDEFAEKWFPINDADRVLEVPEFLSHVRPLRGITHTPLVRPDGSLLTAPGLDELSGILHLPQAVVPPISDPPQLRS
jgi:hypothetical protein